MRIAAIDSYGDRPTIRDVAPPAQLAQGELLVRVRAAGLNPVDSYIAMGAMKSVWPAQFPLTLGSDFAGEIEHTGAAVTRFEVGDAVYGKLANKVLQQGAFGDYVVISERACVSKVPEKLDFAQAASLPTAAMTALVAVEAARVGEGSRVLVNGATGGVGSFALPLAAKRGAHVLATAHDEATEYVRARGAATVIDYRREKLEDAVRAKFSDGIDAIIDLVTSDKAKLLELASLVRKGGAVVSTRGAVDVEALAARGVSGTNVMFQPTAELIDRVTLAIEAGELAPADVRTFPLERVQDALEQVKSGHVHGKLVLATS